MLLKARKAIHSESRKGNPYDNALMESFYRTLKHILLFFLATNGTFYDSEKFGK